jgi:DNA-binding transcriptional LysR family regulator
LISWLTARHNCINLRLPTYGGVYAWESREAGQDLQVRVEGQLTFNSVYQMLDAALDGMGLAYMPEDLTQPHVEVGRLHGVLRDWLVAELSGSSPVLPAPPAILTRAARGGGPTAPCRLSMRAG